MIGNYLGQPDLSPLRSLQLLPEYESLLWIISGEGHQKHADVIGLEFLLAIERERQQPAAARPLSGNSLTDMMSQRVGDLVRHYGGKLIVVPSDAQQPREHADFSARQAKGIDLIAIEHTVFPFKLTRPDVQIDFAHERLDRHDGGDPLAHGPNPIDLGSAPHDAGLAKDLLVGFAADLQFLFGAESQRLLSVARSFSLRLDRATWRGEHDKQQGRPDGPGA
jgi:hypothetical protein